MRYRDLSSKEIVDIQTGTRLGVLGQTDIELDEKTGEIVAFIIPNYSWFGMKKEDVNLRIKWSDIEKIGEDMIMIRQTPISK
ncbi:PRC-barrel domain protein [Paraliobacillus sp. PM-2]|uniref:YlmC/YmxH family sporulation protein n=1 Tax=Paraliobacillus sp. PM-2 TaxID=1462524 RepID=UPI00061BB22D|nr:YlmC/YmxH family sporulation protein [Paraliobacillus sp. PM-2]CQR47648.1 PRC-barrel domain protein [Paraliobacillus sp. PM-2]